MSHRSCFYFTNRQRLLKYKCPLHLQTINHVRRSEGKGIIVSLLNVNIRTHHKQTYSQRITFCSPIILLENPPFILMEIWIKHFKQNNENIATVWRKNLVLGLWRHCSILWGLLKFMFLILKQWDSNSHFVALKHFRKKNENELFVFHCLLTGKQKQY